MARIGISYEQVAAVCDALQAANRSITINSVREALGNTGSPNTIHAHLVKWRAARPVAKAAAYELPPDLVNALGKEMAKAAAGARAEIEEKLVTAQSEAAQLSATGEVLEQQNADLQEQLNDVASERDAADTLASERQVEINHLTDLVQRERDFVGQAQTQAATLQVTVTEQSKEIEALHKQLAKLTTDLQVNTDQRIAAEREKAVAEAKQAAADEAKKTATESLTAALNDAKANAAERYANYEKQLQQAQATEDRINKTVFAMEAKNAELQKRLDAELVKQVAVKPATDAAEVSPVEAPTPPKAAKKAVKKGE
jgi:chromosome segregation ATPase